MSPAAANAATDLGATAKRRGGRVVSDLARQVSAELLGVDEFTAPAATNSALAPPTGAASVFAPAIAAELEVAVDQLLCGGVGVESEEFGDRVNDALHRSMRAVVERVIDGIAEGGTGPISASTRTSLTSIVQKQLLRSLQ